MITMEQLRDRYRKNYEVDPETDLDVELRVYLREEGGKFIAYYGTTDGYEDKRTVTSLDDIVEGFKNFMTNDF